MQVSDISDKVWTDIVLGKMDCDFEFLALKFLLVRLRIKVRYNPTDYTIQSCVDELKNGFKMYEHIPVTHQDLEKIKRIGA